MLYFHLPSVLFPQRLRGLVMAFQELAVRALIATRSHMPFWLSELVTDEILNLNLCLRGSAALKYPTLPH